MAKLREDHQKDTLRIAEAEKELELMQSLSSQNECLSKKLEAIEARVQELEEE